MTIRAVVFDFNGVILNDESVHCDLFQEVLEQENVRFDSQAYHEKYLGYDDRGCFANAMLDAGFSPSDEQINEMVARKARRYLEVAEQGLPFFDRAGECLKAIAQHWPIGINSGALRPEIELSLSRLGVRDCVGPIISAEDTLKGKPDPEGYRLAWEALQQLPGLQSLKPEECLVIEDSLQGILSAKLAGMRTVGVAQTYPMDVLETSGADALLRTTSEFTPEWIRDTFHREATT